MFQRFHLLVAVALLASAPPAVNSQDQSRDGALQDDANDNSSGRGDWQRLRDQRAQRGGDDRQNRTRRGDRDADRGREARRRSRDSNDSDRRDSANWRNRREDRSDDRNRKDGERDRDREVREESQVGRNRDNDRDGGGRETRGDWRNDRWIWTDDWGGDVLRDRENVWLDPGWWYDKDPGGRHWQWDDDRNRGRWWRDAQPALGIYLRDTDRRGAQIDHVVPGSPARRAGLRSGDLLLKVGGWHIHDQSDLRRALRRRDPGDWVLISYRRDGVVRWAHVRLTARRWMY